MSNKPAPRSADKCFVLLVVSLLATTLFLATARDGSAQVLRQRIVSTSGVPHGDMANYRRSPFWRSGMPIGMNRAWQAFLQAEIADITSGADVVLHQGDQVDGRWGQDCDGRGVFGPVRTWAEQVRALRLAGNIYYSTMKRFWGDRDVLFGMGDHETGDIRPGRTSSVLERSPTGRTATGTAFGETITALAAMRAGADVSGSSRSTRSRRRPAASSRGSATPT